MPTAVHIKITAKRQATFPAATLEALRVQPGDYVKLVSEGGAWRLQRVAVDETKLAPLRSYLNPAINAATTFDLNTWRAAPKDHARLRD